MNSIEGAYRHFLDERFALPSEAQVAELEARWHIELPPDYRQFLLQYNGGYFTEPQIISSAPDCPTDRLNNLGGIGASHPSAELGGLRTDTTLICSKTMSRQLFCPSVIP